MLTNRDRQTQADTGLVTTERLLALKHGLLARRDDARASAKRDGLDERFAASLRGKANAYQEAADLVQQLLYGAPMKPPRWSTARRKAQAYQARRRERIAARNGDGQCPGDCPDDCPKCCSGDWALMCDDCRFYAAQDGEVAGLWT